VSAKKPEDIVIVRGPYLPNVKLPVWPRDAVFKTKPVPGPVRNIAGKRGS
jgi:hypothetical protein